MSVQIPVLETDRLRMRGLRADDFPFFCDMMKDEAVMRYIGGKAKTEEEAWTGFLRIIGHWQVMGYGYWMVEEKATGAALGEVGFVDFKRDITPSIKDEPEIGWVFAPAAHGKGYATEAAREAVRWGDEFFNGARMSCIIDPPHTASIRVAEKCGFKETARTTYEGGEIIVLHRG